MQTQDRNQIMLTLVYVISKNDQVRINTAVAAMMSEGIDPDYIRNMIIAAKSFCKNNKHITDGLIQIGGLE